MPCAWIPSQRVNIDAGWLLLHARRFEEAVKQTQRTLAIDEGNHEAESCLARAQFFLGGPPPDQAPEPANPYYRAVLLAQSGQATPALDALEVAYSERRPSLALIRAEPAFRALADEPRYRALLQRMHLE